MVPWLFSWKSLCCFVAEDNSELMVFLRDHFLPWAFFRFSSIKGKLGRNGGLSDVNIIGKVQRLIGLFLLLGLGVVGIGSYLLFELPCSPIDDGIICGEEGHSQEHWIFSKIYDEEWMCIGPSLVVNSEISDLCDFPYAVLGYVDVMDGSGVGEVLNRNGEMVNYVWRNEIFGCTAVN